MKNHYILAKFPKTRPKLPLEYLKIYDEFYQNNRKGKSIATAMSSRLEKWMHKKVGSCLVKENQKILEIGAGTLNHLPYEPKFLSYDIVEPFKDLYKGSKNISLVNEKYRDILEVPNSKKYDKIVSIAAFEHIVNLPEVMSSAGSLLSKDGKLCFAIPSEGTPLWRLAYLLTTGLEFRLKYRLNHTKLMKYEHINNVFEINALAKILFKDVKRKCFGLSNYLSFYQYFECADYQSLINNPKS